MSPPTDETPVLDLLANMTALSVEASDLDPTTLMLVRITALAAVDAPPISYMMNAEAAAEVGIGPEQVRGVLAAIAPIVGTARVASAMTTIAEALAIELEVLDQGQAGSSEDAGSERRDRRVMARDDSPELNASAAAGREVRDELDRIRRGEMPAEHEVRRQWAQVTGEARSRWDTLRAQIHERRH